MLFGVLWNLNAFDCKEAQRSPMHKWRLTLNSISLYKYDLGLNLLEHIISSLFWFTIHTIFITLCFVLLHTQKFLKEHKHQPDRSLLPVIYNVLGVNILLTVVKLSNLVIVDRIFKGHRSNSQSSILIKWTHFTFIVYNLPEFTMADWSVSKTHLVLCNMAILIYICVI